MEFGVVKKHKGVFKLYAEFSDKATKILEADNHWDALEEAEDLYPDAWIDSKIDNSEGRLMKWEDYQDCVDCGGFIDDDGYGYSYDKDLNFIKNVRPSLKKKPEGAAFVLWFNR